MKNFSCPTNIGAGLFESGPVRIQINFPDGTSGEFEVCAMTQDIVIEFEKSGVKFDNYDSQEEALENSAIILRRVLKGGEYEGIKIQDELRDRVLSNVGLTKTILEASRALAEEQVEEEEGN